MVKIYKIPKVKTKDKINGKFNGLMIPIWKDYDPLLAGGSKMKPRFVYFFTCAARSEKGPHLHKKRRGLLTLLEGKALFVYQVGKKFKEIKLDAAKEAIMIDIPKGTGYLIKNLYSKEAKFVNICDYPWRPDDNETITPDFSGYKK